MFHHRNNTADNRDPYFANSAYRANFNEPMDRGYGYSNVDIHEPYATKPFVGSSNSRQVGGYGQEQYHGQFGPNYSQFGWPHMTPFHQGTAHSSWGEPVYSQPEVYWRGYDDHDFFQGRRAPARGYNQSRGFPVTGGPSMYDHERNLPRRTESFDDWETRSGDFNNNASNEVLIAHRYGENVRSNHPNIPMGATVREVIETDSGIRGANAKRGFLAKRHMKMYEVELARAQEHLHRAAQAAKVGDWRAHDALVETALLRQKRADIHWNKAHTA